MNVCWNRPVSDSRCLSSFEKERKMGTAFIWRPSNKPLCYLRGLVARGAFLQRLRLFGVSPFWAEIRGNCFWFRNVAHRGVTASSTNTWVGGILMLFSVFPLHTGSTQGDHWTGFLSILVQQKSVFPSIVLLGAWSRWSCVTFYDGWSAGHG